MPTTSLRTQAGHGGLPPVDEDPAHWGGGDGEGGNERGASRKTSMIGLFVMMIASVMTFASIAGALVIRRKLGSDWTRMPLPPILWPNTAVLLASSVFLDTARRVLRKGKRVLFNWLWCAGTVLGAGFLAGQIYAWRQLNREGFYVAGNASNGFFYVLTWTHAAHAVGGLLALLYVAAVALRFRLGPRKRTVVDVSTAFWHFLDGMWLLLMALIIYSG